MVEQHDTTGSSRGGRSLACSVVTPEATVLETAATFIALPLEDGEIGIAPGHSPFIGRLGHGELRVVAGGGTQRFYIDAGFVQVADDAVSVLTNYAAPAEKLDSTVAERQLSSARAQHGQFARLDGDPRPRGTPSAGPIAAGEEGREVIRIRRSLDRNRIDRRDEDRRRPFA